MKKIKALYKISYARFNETLETELVSIVKVLKDKKSSTELKKHLKNYFIIRVVTMIEDYYRSKAYRIVDEYDLNVKELLDEISVVDILSKNHNITKGQILAINFSFQNPADIDLVFSKLLNLQFATLTSIFNAILFFVNKETKGGIIIWEDFTKLSDLRNNIVHNMNAIVDYDIEKIMAMSRSVMLLLALSDALIEYELTSPHDKKLSTVIKYDEKKGLT